MAKSGTISKSNSECKLEFVWSILDIDRDSLTADIIWQVYLTPFTASSTASYVDVTTTVDGTKYAKREARYAWSANQRFEIDYGTTTVSYDSKGNKSFGVNITAHKTTGSSMSIPPIYESDGTAVLDNLFPKATITSLSVNGTTDETLSQVRVNYSVPKPSETTALTLYVSVGGELLTQVNINKNATSYNVTIPTSYITKALQNNSTSNYFYVNATIYSTIEGYDSSSSSSAKISIVNAEPTFTATIVDTNTSVVNNLTGNANILVKGHSNAQVTVTTTAKKYAYIESETVVNGSNTLEYGSGDIYNVDSGEFIVTVTDSRGLTKTDTIYKTFINYIPITCNMEVDVPSSSGSTTVRVKGNCFYGSFGKVSNTLTVRYRYAADGGAYSNWYSSTVTIVNNNTYSVNFSVTGLDYTKGYTFEAQAVDKLETATSAEQKVKSTPIFDWGEDDFNFNVSVNFAAGYTQPNSALKQLWNGNYQFNGTTTVINLTTPISQLPNGIVLVFAYTDGTTVDDTKIQSFFVSKKVVQVRPNANHTFFLMNGAAFGVVGAKTLKISDTTITGATENGSKTSSSSISFDNTKFVLRDVLGV